ncbi:MAG: beta-lactamase family protein [Proteobacteria bacterium]|nr:beta-lactamase family protein [Pseudomonadota bacterium]
MRFERSKINLISLILVLTIAVFAGCAQKETQIPKLSLAKPEAVEMSSATLSKIGPTVQEYLDRKMIPGAVTLVARKGKVVHFEARGFRDVGAKAPMRRDTIFRIYSMTKPIASVALMILYDEGHFQLDDPISKWLPEFSNPVVAVAPGKAVPAARPITFRHVLTHTAGLSNAYLGDLTKKAYRKAQRRRNREETLADVIRRYATVPLNYHPGDKWQYSRATCVVGRLVEVISEQSLDVFTRERIFEPLKMRDTSYYLPLEKLPRLAASYSPGPGRMIVLLDPASEYSGYVGKPHVYFMGSSGLLSTATDYFRFCQMMLNKGELDGKQILKPGTVELMARNHTGKLQLWLAPGAGFGLGFAVNPVDSESNGAAGTYSWGGAAYTNFWIDPKREMVGVSMTQVMPNSHLNLHKRFSTLANQALVGSSETGKQSAGLGTEFTYDQAPRFTLNFAKGTTRGKPTNSSQVFAAKTPEGVVFQASVNDIPEGIEVKDFAEKSYMPGLETTPIAEKTRITSNAEFTLSDGTKAYKSEVQWIYKPMKILIRTQVMSAYKDGKVVSVTAHPWSNPEEVWPVIESLRFGKKISGLAERSAEKKKMPERVYQPHPELLNTTTYKHDKSPIFSFTFPKDGTKARPTAPNQLLAGKTPRGVGFQAAIDDIPAGIELSEVGPAFYAVNLEKSGAGSEIEVLKNEEIKLKCGTPAYYSEIEWTYMGSRLLITQLVSAYKNGKWISISAHPWQFPSETTPIVKSLNFCD